MITRMRPLLLVGSLVVLTMLAVSAWAWPQIPFDAQVPIHWDPGGEVDRYGSKEFGLLGLPFINLGLMLLLAFLPVIEPRRQNLLRSHTAYLAIGIATVVFMGGVHILVVMTALGDDTDTSTVVLAGAAVLFLLIGNYLGKTRSNWFFGIRTPWTLSSELSWTRTHRVASWLFIAVGVGTLFTALVAGTQPALWTMLGGLLVGGAGVVVYSYFVWKGDAPGRTYPTRLGD